MFVSEVKFTLPWSLKQTFSGCLYEYSLHNLLQPRLYGIKKHTWNKKKEKESDAQ